MIETRIMCDRQGCKKEGLTNSIFKERKTNGAGSGENTYYVFDLCHYDQSVFLNELLIDIEKGPLYTTGVVLALERLNVKWRIE